LAQLIANLYLDRSKPARTISIFYGKLIISNLNISIFRFFKSCDWKSFKKLLSHIRKRNGNVMLAPYSHWRNYRRSDQLFAIAI